MDEEALPSVSMEKNNEINDEVNEKEELLELKPCEEEEYDKDDVEEL